MNVIARGAEAVLERENEVVRKNRVEKPYRHPRIDEALRRERTRTEARLLEKAGRYIATPNVVGADTHSFTMEFVDGTPVKELGFEAALYQKIGESIAALHAHNVIHGDLTTSNMLKTVENVVFIDFGLGFHSQRVEDKAVDLRVFKEALHSTHPSFWEEAFETVENAYKKNYGKSGEVLKRLSRIETRGRYTNR